MGVTKETTKIALVKVISRGMRAVPSRESLKKFESLSIFLSLFCKHVGFTLIFLQLSLV